MIKTIFFTAFAALSLIIACDGYCDNYYDTTEQNLKTMDGTVSSVDVQASKITVKGISTETFSVPSNASIRQDVYDIKLSDVKPGDYVTVEFSVDDSGKRQAETITVEYDKPESPTDFAEEVR